MIKDYTQDPIFLREVNQYPVKFYRAKVGLLDFQTERFLSSLEGHIISGNISVTGKSTSRRSGSLTILFTEETMNLTHIENAISLNKKISISIGYDNPFYRDSTPGYYGDQEILWFKQGVFVITGASSSWSGTSGTVTINFSDKMSFLNGYCGGIIPAAAKLNQKTNFDRTVIMYKEDTTIDELIREIVIHFGGEAPANIIINDLPDYGGWKLKYVGDQTLYLVIYDELAPGTDNERRVGYTFSKPPQLGRVGDKVYQQTSKGQIIGTLHTPLEYPGELSKKAGDTVTSALDDIVKALGNYEYFYDREGNFVFQRKQNFEKTGRAPINLRPSQDNELWQSYVPQFGDDQYLLEFINTSLVTSVSYKPNYEKIKNDFVVWGTAEKSEGVPNSVRYHLAIDDRPQANEDCLCYKNIYSLKKIKTIDDPDYEVDEYVGYILDGESYDVETQIKSVTPVAPNLKEKYLMDDGSDGEMPADYQFDWREELYRRALLAVRTSEEGSYYDQELLTEWRKIYDPISAKFRQEWNDTIKVNDAENVWVGYSPNIVNNSGNIRYWLDIIDSSSALGEFSVQNIGRRTVAQENDKINRVFPYDHPNVTFIIRENMTQEKVQEIINYYRSVQQQIIWIPQKDKTGFQTMNDMGSCYEDIRDLLYDHIFYNASVTLGCVPLLYFDVNKVVRLNFPGIGVVGNYVVESFSINFGQFSTMSLQLAEAKVII